VDPSSGTASMMELTRSLGELPAARHPSTAHRGGLHWNGEEYCAHGFDGMGEQFAMI